MARFVRDVIRILFFEMERKATAAMPAGLVMINVFMLAMAEAGEMESGSATTVPVSGFIDGLVGAIVMAWAVVALAVVVVVTAVAAVMVVEAAVA